MDFIEFILSPKGATIFVFLLSILISLITSTTQRLLTDVKKMAVWRKEVADWTKEYNKAKREANKKEIARLKKKEKYMMDLQKKMMWSSMRPTLLFFIPFIIIWQVILIPLYANHPVVAYFPGIGGLNVVYWYMVCSFMSGTLIQKALGITMEAPEGPATVPEEKKKQQEP